MKKTSLSLSALLSLSCLSGCGGAVETLRNAPAAQTSASAPNVASQTNDLAPETKEVSPVFEAKIDGDTRLFKSRNDISEFMDADIDTKTAMIKRGFLAGLPALSDGDTVTVVRPPEDEPYASITTADGKEGWMIYSLIRQPQKSLDQIADESNTGHAYKKSVVEHGQPKTLPFGKTFISEGLQYTILKAERKSLIGSEDDSAKGWAKADPGFIFMIVTYRAKNVTDDAQSLNYSQALIDTENHLYPSHVVATAAVWEEKTFEEPLEIQPGKVITCSQAFYVPIELPVSKLFYMAPDGVLADNFKYKIALAKP